MRRLALLCLLLAAPFTQAAQERLALVIGNAAYENEAPLTNTLNDARDVAAKLEGLGFSVTKVENAGLRTLGRSLADFLRRVQGSDAVALLYYSGHGLQVNGRNYLIPVDAQIRDELDVPREGVPVNEFLRELGGRGDAAVNLVILDACRDNPFKKSGSKAIGDKGLARLGDNAPSGTLILYATKPGETASDNPGGRNGLFTQHLLQAMEQPGKQVEDAFKAAAEQVYVASGRKQDPWMEGRIRGQFFFVPAPPGAPGVAPDPELMFWQSTAQCGTAACYGEYLKAYPQGRFAGLARVQVQRMGAPPPPPPPVPAVPDPAAVEQALGLKREERAQIQAALNALGHDVGAADGILGNNTRSGIAAWQQAARLEATGYLDAESYKRLLAQAEPRLAAQRQAEAQAQAQARAEAERRAREPAARGPGEPQMVAIPGGCFLMGSPSGEKDHQSDERQHRVCVEAFRLAQHEVNNREFRRFRPGHDSGDYQGRSLGGDDQPVVNVSWTDALAYAEWLSRQSGRRYRLPTEAEWEYAARAGTTAARYWGEGPDPACRYANVHDLTSKRLNTDFSWEHHNCDDGQAVTAPVGRYQANPWGLHDMLGNVWEWTCSAYAEGYDGSETRCSSNNHAGLVAIRGGSWDYAPWLVRAAYRDVWSPDSRVYNLGLRLAQD